MRRGFLNNTQSTGMNSLTAQTPSQDRFRAADNSSPPDMSVLGFQHTQGTLQLKAHLSAPDYTRERSLICTRVPSTPIDSRGTTECALVPETMRHLSRFPTHPRSPVQEPATKAYEIRPIDTKGLGMFATRNLEVGDLILVERPLMVLPTMKHTEDRTMTPDELATYLRSFFRPAYNGPGYYFEGIPRLQAVLVEALFERMKKDDQDSFKNLANIYEDEGHFFLLGRARTNSADIGDMGLGDGSLYEAVCRATSRINHSCRPNCGLSFDVSSFSVEVRASKAIAKDEEILRSYSVIAASTNERQAQLKKWKFTCTCDSCKRNPANPKNDKIRVSIPVRIKYLNDNIPEVMHRLQSNPLNIMMEISSSLVSTRAAINNYRAMVNELLNDLKKEGLEGSIAYARAMKYYGVAIVGHSLVSAAAALPNDRIRYQEVKAELGREVQKMVDYNTAHFGSGYDGQGFFKFARENLL